MFLPHSKYRSEKIPDLKYNNNKVFCSNQTFFVFDIVAVSGMVLSNIGKFEYTNGTNRMEHPKIPIPRFQQQPNAQMMAR